MAPAHPIQAQLPRFNTDGITHARGCLCPRCRGWVDRQTAHRAAEAAVARRREKKRVKALALELELEEEERRTAEYLAAQSKILEGLKHDPRLDILLASREAGKPANEAIAEVERRFSTPTGSEQSKRR